MSTMISITLSSLLLSVACLPPSEKSSSEECPYTSGETTGACFLLAIIFTLVLGVAILGAP